MQPTLWISTAAELEQGLALLSRSDFVALDTEFMRERTYYAGLCLIQAATPDACIVIDPLALRELQPLWQFLSDRSRVKVLHAARQDLEVLSLAMSPAGNSASTIEAMPIPGPIFDTQTAAGLLGQPAQIGYASLVGERLGHVLPKGQTRTDWSRRPLSAEQLVYAADDVRYLALLYPNLLEALQAAGRLQWQQEEAVELENPRLYRVDPADAWRRLKGLERLRPEQRATAKLLAGWRESRAMSKDRPRGWILSDESLRDIAERLPTTLPALESIRSLSPGFIDKRADEMLALVAQGLSNAANEGPSVMPSRREPEQTARVTKLMAFVRAEGARQAIAPELLATRRDAEQLVFSGRSDHLLQGWRREVIGERLVALATR
ncbi:MAG TPA: ribonuclease D [Povalibacter sp.]|nr:ribonuclease D [Povalibacter sp.]